jgi:hypothetical protein
MTAHSLVFNTSATPIAELTIAGASGVSAVLLYRSGRRLGASGFVGASAISVRLIGHHLCESAEEFVDLWLWCVQETEVQSAARPKADRPKPQCPRPDFRMAAFVDPSDHLTKEKDNSSRTVCRGRGQGTLTWNYPINGHLCRLVRVHMELSSTISFEKSLANDTATLYGSKV